MRTCQTSTSQTCRTAVWISRHCRITSQLRLRCILPFLGKHSAAKRSSSTMKRIMDAVLDLLPPELTPMTDPPVVIVLSERWLRLRRRRRCLYARWRHLLNVMYQGEPHIFPWVVYLGRRHRGMVLPHGREVLGDSKKTRADQARAAIWGRGMMLGTVERPVGTSPCDNDCRTISTVRVTRTISDLILLSYCDYFPAARPVTIAHKIAELSRKRVKATIRKAAEWKSDDLPRTRAPSNWGAPSRTRSTSCRCARSWGASSSNSAR